MRYKYVQPSFFKHWRDGRSAYRNKVVHANDTVYILGDLIYKSDKSPSEYLSRLKGKKHLILGNHDKTWIEKDGARDFFECVTRLEIINTGKGKATLCHFPMVDHEGR